MSEIAFAKLLSSWIVRDLRYDYGVDKEVEIFHGDMATGKTFKVQLKSTDKDAPKKGYSQSIRIQTLNYWRALDVPVMLVLYSTKKDQIYARWAQSYDPHYAKKRDGKSVTFSFTEHDRFNGATAESRILRELDLIQKFRQKSADLPIPVILNVSPDLHGLGKIEVESRIRMAIRNCNHILKIDNDSDFALKLTINGKRIRTEMPANIASATFHFDKSHSPRKIDKVCSDAMVVLSTFLLGIGLARESADILIRYGKMSHLYDFPERLNLFFEGYISVKLFSEAWKIVKPVYDAANPKLTVLNDLWLNKIIMDDYSHMLGRDDYLSIIESFERRAEKEKESGNYSVAGSAIYNIGELYRTIYDDDKAKSAFDQAAILDPEYLSRGYYLRAVAGLEFLRQNHERAAELYQKAVDIGDPPESSYLLADTLMHLGRYSDAAAVTIDVDSLSDRYKPGARLCKRVIKTVLQVTGLLTQVRQKISPETYAEICSKEAVGDALSLLRELDALHPGCWYTLAYQQPDNQSALEHLLVAAVLKQDDPKMWTVALLFASMDSAADELRNDICRSAFDLSSGDFLTAIDQATNGPPEELKEACNRAKQAAYAYSQTEQATESRVVRIHGPGGFKTLRVDESDDRETLNIIRQVASWPAAQIDALMQDFQRDQDYPHQ